MTKRRAFLAISVCIAIISATTSLNAQDKDSCAGVGWEPLYIEQLSSLVGTFTVTNNRDCNEAAKWQYSATITIRKDEQGQYWARVYSGEKETEFRVSGNQVRFTRSVQGSAGKDKRERVEQFWSGTLQRNRRTGSIRIYGTWSGAYDYVTDGTKYNHDFMILIK